MKAAKIPHLLNDVFNCQVCRNRSNFLQEFTEEMWLKLKEEAANENKEECLYCLGKLRAEMKKRDISFEKEEKKNS